MLQKILTDRVGYEPIIEEVRKNWLIDLLEYIGVDVEYVLEYPQDYIKEYLIENNISIEYYTDIGASKVSYKNEVIGEWLGPSFVLKEEDGDIYYEISLEAWSIMEEEED